MTFFLKAFYHAKNPVLVAIHVSFPSNQRRECSAVARTNDNFVFLIKISLSVIYHISRVKPNIIYITRDVIVVIFKGLSNVQFITD